MDVLQLLISVVGSAFVTGIFGYLMKRKDTTSSTTNTRATVEADAYARAQKIYEGALAVLERENSALSAENESLKLLEERRKP